MRISTVSVIMMLALIGIADAMSQDATTPVFVTPQLNKQQATAKAELPAMPVTVKLSSNSCDQTLWNHVWGENPSLTYRLLLNATYPCINVTGVVDNITAEYDDGDYHINIHLDPQYTNLLNQANINDDGGDLVTEVVCANSGKINEAVCNNFNQSYLLNNLSVGSHISVIGEYVTDLGFNGQAEIHPITSISPVSADIQKSFIIGRGDNALWYRSYNGTSWDSWTSLGGYASSPPAVEILGSKTYTFFRGGDNAIWYRSYDGVSWSGEQSLAGFVVFNFRVITYGSNLYLFVVGGDSSGWYKTYNGTSWSDWRSIGGYITSDPEVGIYNSTLYVFVRGGDYAEWYKTYNGTSWSDWRSMGGSITSDPEVGIYNSTLYVFVRGGDYAEWYKTYNGTSWSNWQGIGGYVISDSKVDVYNSSLYVFVRGGDKSIYYQKWNGSVWSGWQNMGGYTIDDSETISLSNLYLYVIGGDGAEWYKKYDGTSWSGWQSLGGDTIFSPEVVSN